MARYRKRPVVIEAVQVPLPDPTVAQTCDATPCCGEPSSAHVYIETLEGRMRACPGDWIITGVNGERYPCKPDIFAKTYEPVD